MNWWRRAREQQRALAGPWGFRRTKLIEIFGRAAGRSLAEMDLKMNRRGSFGSRGTLALWSAAFMRETMSGSSSVVELRSPDERPGRFREDGA
jgi:hypothetical protein